MLSLLMMGGINKRSKKPYKTCVACREKVRLKGIEYRKKNKAKIAAANKVYREANKAKIAAKDKAYREKNKEKIAKQRKEYRDANKDKERERFNKWKAANREKYDNYHKKYYQEHKETLLEQCKEHRLKNITRYRLTDMIRASRNCDKKANRYDEKNQIDREWLNKTILSQDWKCDYCSCKMLLDCDPYDKNLMTVERKDNSIGHTKDNTVLACLGCNCKRSQRGTYDEFKAKMKGLPKYPTIPLPTPPVIPENVQLCIESN
jgi:hypothetical protein